MQENELKKLKALFSKANVTSALLLNHAENLQLLISETTEVSRNRNCHQCQDLLERMAQANELAYLLTDIAEVINA